jgi:hypothetical protein
MSSVGDTSARDRLETVWKTLQPYLTEEVCEEVLEVLQVVTANAIEEKKRIDLRRLSNINALEQLQKISGAKGEPCFLFVCAHALYLTFTVITPIKPSLKTNKPSIVVGLGSEEPKQRGRSKKLVVTNVVDDAKDDKQKPKKRGRPEKLVTDNAVDSKDDPKGDEDAPKKRGRPKSSKLIDAARGGKIVKSPQNVNGSITGTKRGRGRPKKLK